MVKIPIAKSRYATEDEKRAAGAITNNPKIYDTELVEIGQLEKSEAIIVAKKKD